MHFNGFYFNPLSVKINVESQISLDPPSQKAISKIFHNKIVTFPFEVLKSFAKTIDPGFLLGILGPAGFLLLILAPFEIFRGKKRKLGTIHLTLVLAALIFSLGPISPKIAFWVISLSLYTFSFWGISAAVKNKYVSFLFVVLIFYSLWYFAINWQMPTLCNEIFFN